MTVSGTASFIGTRAAATWRRGGVSGVLADGLAYVRAMWQLRSATTRRHARCWGRVIIHNRGQLRIGDRTRIEGTLVPVRLTCHEGARLDIGEGTYINYGADISATSAVTIGRGCAIGQYAIILDNDYHRTESHLEFGDPAPVVIEDDVWLGARVTVLRGAHIGAGAVIGANSVVRGVIPPGTLAAGVPATVIRSTRREDPR